VHERINGKKQSNGHVEKSMNNVQKIPPVEDMHSYRSEKRSNLITNSLKNIKKVVYLTIISTIHIFFTDLDLDAFGRWNSK
jgi:hypothetical protein